MDLPLAFEQVSTTALYEIRGTNAAGWAGYVLPTTTDAPCGTPDLPSSIAIADSLHSQRGSYLFAVRRPPIVDSDPCTLVRQANDYISANAGANRTVVWLEGVNPLAFGDFERFGFSFGQDIWKDFVLQSNLNAALGQQMNFFALAGLYVSIDEDRGALVVSTGKTGNPLLGFQKHLSDMGITIGDAGSQSAAIPFSGPNAGCFVFAARITPSITFSTSFFDLGFTYVINDRQSGKEVRLAYPAFHVNALPKTLSCLGVVDPSDPVNSRLPSDALAQGYFRTGFALTVAPSLASAFRTPTGRAVSLIPLGAASGSAPPARAGAFALASASRAGIAIGQDDVYFAPAGTFGISVQDQEAGTAQELLCGLFGSERLTFVTYSGQAGAKNDVLVFLPGQPAYAPIFPFETADLDRPGSGSVRPRLTGDFAAPWATIFAGAGPVDYRAEPEGSPLYGADSAAWRAGDDAAVPVLLATPPRLPLPQGITHTFPLTPYAGIVQSGVDGRTLTQFESQILAATRKTIISDAADETWQTRAAALATLDGAVLTTGTTPQGLVVQTEPGSGTYVNVTLAQSTGRDGKLIPFAFDRPTRRLQDALQTNQLFLVAVTDRPFDDITSGATFENVVHIADWTLTAQVGKGATPTSYRNVMILKFCDGSLQERVTNPNRWTAPRDFSLVDGADDDLAPVAYTGLSQWLQAYVEAGIERADGPSGTFYQTFKRIVTDPSWNGLIVLQADLSATDLPPQIQGLAPGIDFTHFTAHHFGFTVTRVTVDRQTGEISMQGNSSLFGLIDYQDPAYALNLMAGVSPEIPIAVQTSDDFDFTVLQLQSRFENTKLVEFSSRVQLTVDRLFGSPVLQAFSNGGPMPARGIVLDGSYIDQNGTGVYVFQQTRGTVFTLDSNVLPAVAFQRVQFNTLGERDGGDTNASRFLIWGSFDFVELADTSGELLDVLSFGSPLTTNAPDLGQGLAFSNLVIEMTYPVTTPSAKRFALDTDNLAYDLNASVARADSLFRGFGLQPKRFINAAGDQTPAGYGFLPVTSMLNLQPLSKPWFGVVYEVTMGGPGSLVAAAGFSSELLLAWSPSAAIDANRAVFIGLSLPGAAPGASLFSIEGVFKVAVGSIALLRQAVPRNGSRATAADQYFYCLRLDDIGIKILGIVKLPPSATIQFFLFGDPSNTGSLGWYAAYVAADNPGCNQQTLGLTPVAAALEHARVPGEAAG